MRHQAEYRQIPTLEVKLLRIMVTSGRIIKVNQSRTLRPKFEDHH
jgi:hypothetical protein